MAETFKFLALPSELGTFFVDMYYEMLQNHPDEVLDFYSDASTMVRIDGNTRDTATTKLQIQQLLMTLNYMEIELKITQSLESWHGGLLVMVCGLVRIKVSRRSKMFVETFFLAPQEKGYLVLSDIFHYVDEEQILQHQIAFIPQRNFDAKSSSSDTVEQETKGGDIQSLELISPAKVEENDSVSSCNNPEEHLQQIHETENIPDNMQSNNSCQGPMTSTPDHLSSPIEEPVVETQKHAYAFTVAEGQSAAAMPSESYGNKPDSFKRQHVPESPIQASVSSPNTVERSGVEEASVLEDEVEVKQVYVRNVPTTMSASEIAEEFKKFGKVKPDGVVIKTRKNICDCYAFVEFEDLSGVQNAVEASEVQIGAYQLCIERLRPKRNISLLRGKNKGEDIQSPKHNAAAKVEENDPVSECKNPEHHLEQTTETENILDDEQPTNSCQLAKGKSAAAKPSQSSCDKPDSSKGQHVLESPGQASVSSRNPIDMSQLEEAAVLEDEVEVKQVFVRNVPTTMSASEIAEEFNQFGKVKTNGVVIKTQKDMLSCYAFVAFEDISGVQNAIKASVVQIGNHKLSIERLRPKRNISLQGGIEVKKVYVSNVPLTISASEIAEEFEKFGKVKPDGVVIKPQDARACYAFVEFEDISGVQNAIKASIVQIGAQQLYVEQLRPRRNISL